MRALVLAAFALAVMFAPSAAFAQSGRPSLEAFASDPGFRSAGLSPDGRYVIGVRTDARGDTL
ncbi:MAG TPA: hypothetical protein PLS69_03670, partial [Terricaulis sp.]|nr:hypothetical protein [Terricaulis sp.]